MKKLLKALLIGAFLLSAHVHAQTSPGLVYGQVPSASDWNGYFSSKLDYVIPGTTGNVLTSNGTIWISSPISQFTYPGAGVACSTGTAWCASYVVGVGANNLVQLNGSAQIPALNGSLVTNLTPANISAGTAGISVSGNSGTVTNGLYSTGSYSNPTWLTSILGSIVSGAVPTATSLAATPTQCATGSYFTGIAANGNAQGCTAVTTGTVTGVSVATANGLAGSSSGGATPILTLSTTLTGLVKGNGTAFSAASGSDINTAFGSQAANTFYAAPNGTAGNPAFRLILAADIPTLNQNTTGSAGSVSAANITGTTLAANVTASSLLSANGGSFGTGAFNPLYVLPNATTSVLGGVKCDGTTTTCTLGVITAVAGSAITVGTTTVGGGTSPQILYNNAGVLGNEPASSLTVGTATNLTGSALSGDVTNSGNAITFAAVNSNIGSFTNANITVNAKGLITAASNGSGGSGTVTTSGTPASGNLAQFSGATVVTNGNLSGDVTTSGTLAVTVVKINGTSLSGLATGLLKNTTSTGVPSIAVAGTDYAPATSGSSILYGNGTGGFSNVTIGSNLTFSGSTLSASGGSTPAYVTAASVSTLMTNFGGL